MRATLLVALALLTACTRDLRPEGTRSGHADRVERGRALLAKAEAAHGGRAAFERYAVLGVDLRDVWQGIARLANPWPEADVRVRMEMARGRSLIRATFLEGDDADTVWGVQDGRTWIAVPGEAVDHDHDDDVRFILAALQYFFEFPFRIGEAPIVFDAGPATIGDTTYDRVFATWQSAEPNGDYDQYVVYLDRETGRVAKIHFTVREYADFFESTMHFDDLREVNGLLLPHRLSLTDTPADDPDDWLHRVTVTRYRFDEVEAAALAP